MNETRPDKAERKELHISESGYQLAEYQDTRVSGKKMKVVFSLIC